MVYPSLLPLMRTPRLPVVDWTEPNANLNGLVRFAERRNIVSARVPSHFNWPLLGSCQGRKDFVPHKKPSATIGQEAGRRRQQDWTSCRRQRRRRRLTSRLHFKPQLPRRTEIRAAYMLGGSKNTTFIYQRFYMKETSALNLDQWSNLQHLKI